MSHHILLRTERLALRRLAADDVEHLCALDNDPLVMRWINGGAPTPQSVIAQQILPGLMHYDERHPWSGVWAAEDRQSGGFVGWISLRLMDQGEAVLGYRLCRAAWGQGLASEGARALIAQAWADPAVQRITATTYEENLASQRLLLRLGFGLVRRFRLTPEELHASDTSHNASDDVWDGDELAYTLERAG